MDDMTREDIEEIRAEAVRRRVEREQTDRRGLYQKFVVARVDRSDAPGGKHDGCDYFVLDLRHDRHAVPALRAYAESCAVDRPVLAAELSDFVGSHWLAKEAGD